MSSPEQVQAAAQANLAKASAAAQAQADAYAKDDALAASKGKLPEQIEARRRVLALFCQIHWPKESPEAIKHQLEQVDYTMTVTTTNGRLVDMEHPKGIGIMGTGRKPSYLVSKAYPPKKPEDPIYAVEYFALKQ